MKKSEIFDFYKINLIRNIIQYSLGAGFYFIINNDFSITKFLLGLIGFLIAYQSVYFFNDIMDYEEDRKNKFKSKIKLLVTGKVKKETLISLSFLFTILGVSISFLVNRFFGLLVFMCLLLNFFHSSNLLRVKKSKLLLPNLFFIEYIKYSLGWFSLSFKITNFPFIVFIFTSSAYLVGYLYYKNDVNLFLRDFRIKILSIITFIFYLISIFIYPFKLPLLFLFALSISFLLIKRIHSFFIKIKMSNLIFSIIIISFILSMFFLTTPSMAELNDKMTQQIDIIKENITEMIPKNIRYNIESIQEKININIKKFETKLD